MRFEATLFDLDGTLLDTEALGLEAGLATLEAQGFPRDRDFLLGLIGKDDKTVRALIEARFPDMDFARNDAIFQAEVLRLETAQLPLKPSVDDVISAVEALNLPRAVVTSSRAHRAEWKLRHAGLIDRFQAVVSVDDVREPKPAPEPFLLAAELLGVSAAACLVFEDSDTGAASARAAGMQVVQVPDLGTTTREHAHIVAGSLLEGAAKAGLGVRVA